MPSNPLGRGRVQGVGTSIVSTQTYLRVSALHDPFLHLAVAAGGATVGLLGTAAAGIAWMRGFRRRPGRARRRARASEGLVVLANVSVVVALGCVAIAASAPGGVEDVIARQSLLLSVPFTVATLLSTAAVVAAGVLGGSGRSRRVGNVLGGLGALAVCVVAVGYHLSLFPR